MITMIYLFAKKLDLPILTVMNKDGILNEVAGLYNGLDRFEARKKLSTELEETGLAVRKKLTHQEFLDLNVVEKLNVLSVRYVCSVKLGGVVLASVCALKNEFVILSCSLSREIIDDAKAFATGNRAIAALFVHTPVGELLHILDAALSTTVSKIMIAVAQYVDVHLSELRGKSPIAVFNDVDIDKARVYNIWLLLDQRPNLQCNNSSHTTYVSGCGGNYTNTYGLVVYGVCGTSKIKNTLPKKNIQKDKEKMKAKPKQSVEKRKRSSKSQEEDNVEEGASVESE
ncbi:valine--tRNA ligase, chloroplastic/mitochondrial 2 isoform X1 [Tanacetum coccineum]